MADALELFGFGPSVYTRAVRIALIELGLNAAYIEVDPFADVPDPVLATVSRFDRVPVLRHGDFVLTETAAILRYLNGLGAASDLEPGDLQAQARMAQVMGIVDADVYWPLVRDVYSHGHFRPRLGLDADPSRIVQGLSRAAAPLAVLDQIAREGLVLVPHEPTLADFHLVPMIAAFVQVPAGATLLKKHPELSSWWSAWRSRPSLLSTAVAV